MISPAELLEHAESLDGVRLVERILRAGLLTRASDVHFDPSADGTRVRFRIDGVLEEVMRIPSGRAQSVVSRLKVLGGVDIAERRAPQDGGFAWRPEGPAAGELAQLDVRLATIPVRHGERVTLRLLETCGHRLTLAELGMRERELGVFNEVLRRPHGLVLITGPTGSGKTTTLYAAIRALLESAPLNILTVEDPIEYDIPGVAQVEVDSADKVNFEKALRSLLRHDPDAVMIGEIRDGASLDAAVKAALTGHLVLSTLHANDARSTETRLVDLGLDAKLVPVILRLAVSQRLVRRLCPGCRGASGNRACPVCGGRGYAGRIGLFELYAPGSIATSIADDAAAKVEAGVTSREEVVRALGS